MNRNRVLLPLAAALLATLALAGCKKKEAVETPTTNLPPAAATLPAPAPMPAAAAATVTSVDLGKAAGADMKITAPTNTFAHEGQQDHRRGEHARLRRHGHRAGEGRREVDARRQQPDRQ